MKLNKLPLNVIGLNRVGLNQIGSPSHRANTSDRPYIDPEVLASLVAVCICDGKSNNDPDRAAIKNLVDPDNPFIISNAAYKLNSGYGLYEEDFTTWINSPLIDVVNRTNELFHVTNNTDTKRAALSYNLTPGSSDLKGYKIKVEIIKGTGGEYKYYNEEGKIKYFTLNESKIYTLPTSHNSILTTNEFNAFLVNPNSSYRVTQIPSHQGAFVTDGIDDLITSTKTVQEMLGGSNEITVVSMMLNLENEKITYTNQIRPFQNGYIRNNVISNTGGKYGIYGYKITDISDIFKNRISINDVLGDRKDYGMDAGGTARIDGKFSVEGYCFNDGTIGEMSQVAWYWTFISNKALTTDQINQVISYFNLDKHVKPDVYYDVKKQGLSNDTPAADWYLKDFSGNGHDMQLYNYAKKLNSGVGKYEMDFSIFNFAKQGSECTIEQTPFSYSLIKNDNQGVNSRIYAVKFAGNTEVPEYKVKVEGLQNGDSVNYWYVDENSKIAAIPITENGERTIPKSYQSSSDSRLYYQVDIVSVNIGTITVTQIPDYEGALVSDGKDDYGHADNLPIFKDYTVAIDRAWINLVGARAECLSTKNSDPDWGAFNFELSESISRSTFSFGGTNSVSIDVDRKISYQSKYSYNGATIAAGNIVDGKDLFLFRSRSAFPYYAEAAIWSYLLFPYSLSEFLLERQLKKYKLGTLYPDMVEFRPVVKSNVGYDKIVFHYQNKDIQNGTYLAIGSEIVIYVRLSSNPSNEIKTLMVNGTPAIFMSHDTNINVYQYKFYLSDKSPQKINITVDEYIRFEDIVQPYPIIVNLSQDGKILTWGDKLKVGSEVVVTNYTILLPELYTHGGGIRYNGTTINLNAPIVVAKSMVFTNVHTWKLNTTEPHAIYSPQKLNIPNSSLKILGYIPDLTGKGNHGKLNNFAYTEDSGVAADGSVKFDGTDDHITIPTLAHGGKCVMMKVNWSNDGMLYDQRPSGGHNTFGIYTGENHPAYSARNNGSTYIDGILNTNIIPSNLAGITHNITAVNDTATDNSTTYPRLGTSFTNATFSDMSLYEFMLFPEIPSEDEIKKLNDVMGIEGGYVESPNYYWDAYGKANRASADIDYKDLSSASDAHKQLIDKSIEGLAAIELYHSTGNFSGIRDRRLYLNNVAYNSESGYGGKGFVPFNGDWRHDENKLDFQFITNGIHVTKGKATLSNWFWTNNPTVKGAKTKYKITGVTFDRAIRFFNGLSEYQLVINKDGIYEVDGSLLVDGDGNPTGLSIGDNGWVGDCDIVIEQLTEYPNGLLLDGVDDHAVNTVIPAVTDFTVIAKREWINKDTIGNECFIHKGVINTPIGETAFMLEYEIANDTYYRSSSYGGYINIERTNRPEKIIYQTPTSYNGTAITKGSGTDTIGLTLGAVTNNYWHGVFYKLMFYTKTIDQLSINMLKNLFERDELIDVTNPIFKKQ